MKECSKCGETKPLDQFARHRTGKLGRHSYCRDCKRAYDRLYREKKRESAAKSNARHNVQSSPDCDETPTGKATPLAYKHNTHETEDGFIISGKGDQKRQIEAAGRVATQLRASVDALEIYFPERHFDTTFTRAHARKLAAELSSTRRRIGEHLSTLNEYGNGENHNA